MLRKIKFRNDNKGVIAIEYAVMLPFFFALVLAVIELSFITFASIILANSTTLAARQAKIGDVDTDALVTRIRESIQENSSILINADKIIITTADPETFGTMPKPERCYKTSDASAKPPIGKCPAGWVFDDLNGNNVYDYPPLDNVNTRGERIRLTSYYEWKVITPGLGHLIGAGDKGGLFNGSNTYVISSTTYVQNEKY